MSPASQGALEVERYIGSCLISSNVRAGLHGKPVAVCRKQEQQPAAVVRGGKARGGCYNGGQGYPGLADQQQCQVPYGGPGGWTGAPLISMTSSPRRCTQRSSPSLGQQQQQQQQQTCTTDQQQSVPTSNGQLHKNPLSRLAIHTQGAPLILAGRFYNRGKLYGNGSSSNNNNNSSGGGGSNGSTVCANVGNYAHNSVSATSSVNGATRCPASRIAAQRPAEAGPPKKPPSTAAMTPSNPKANADCPTAAGKENAGIANIDSLSIASDESSGSNNSENSLPRIIKPRKRRKKDRKPPNNVVATTGVDVAKTDELPASTQQRQQSVGCGAIASEQSCVNKSYAPACYEPRIYEAAAASHLRNYRRPPLGHRENIYGGTCRAPSMQQQQQQQQQQQTETMADVRQQRYAAHHHRHHVQVKVLDDNRNVVAPPPPMRATAAPLKGYHHRHHHGNGNCNNSNLPRRYAHTEYANTSDSCEAAARGDGLGSCQCRYCDPAGLIWDVDRNGYSPFLTAPPPPPPLPPSSSSSSSSSSGVEYCRGGHHFGQIPLFLAPACSNLPERALDRLFDEDPRPHDDCRGGDAAGPAVGPGGVILRRSWSDPTSYFSYGEEIAAPTRDVGVIGDRGGQFEGGKHKRALWRGDSIGSANSSAGANAAGPNTGAGGPAAPPKGLEVSTEIITSPNGHRDLEIKFYSSPSPASERLVEEDKSSSSLAEEADDDDHGDDDFSDIWSYHESKLQQDFRTLLQAEE